MRELIYRVLVQLSFWLLMLAAWWYPQRMIHAIGYWRRWEKAESEKALRRLYDDTEESEV